VAVDDVTDAVNGVFDYESTYAAVSHCPAKRSPTFASSPAALPRNGLEGRRTRRRPARRVYHAPARYREVQAKYSAILGGREPHFVVRGIVGDMGAVRARAATTAMCRWRSAGR
jgi:hypothetical protein